MNTVSTIVAVTILSLSAAFSGQRDITIKCIIGIGKDAIALPESTSPMEVSITRDVTFPTEWTLPGQEQDKEGRKIIAAVRSTDFETAKAGWVVRCSAERLNEFIRLKGSAIFTEAEMGKGLYGEHSGPIYAPGGKAFLENKAETASFLSSISNFQLFAIPGKEYEIKVRRLNKWIPCRIICDFATK